MCTPTESGIAARIEWAFTTLLQWAVVVPINNWLEQLHILANQPMVGTLVGNQLTCYACMIEEGLEYSVDE